jgi:F-type H+-transporting ATPase subunit b
MDNSYILSEIAVQIIGFMVVFFVLKKLAWSKLLGAVDARRKTIEDAFLDIENRKKSIESLEKEYRYKIENIEQEARGKIQEAANQGLLLAKDIQDKARADADKMIARAKSEIEQDVAKAKISLRDDIVSLSSLMTEKIIREKLDAKEHQKLVDRFIQEIEQV